MIRFKRLGKVWQQIWCSSMVSLWKCNFIFFLWFFKIWSQSGNSHLGGDQSILVDTSAYFPFEISATPRFASNRVCAFNDTTCGCSWGKMFENVSIDFSHKMDFCLMFKMYILNTGKPSVLNQFPSIRSEKRGRNQTPILTIFHHYSNHWGSQNVIDTAARTL